VLLEQAAALKSGKLRGNGSVEAETAPRSHRRRHRRIASDEACLPSEFPLLRGRR